MTSRHPQQFALSAYDKTKKKSLKEKAKRQRKREVEWLKLLPGWEDCAKGKTLRRRICKTSGMIKAIDRFPDKKTMTEKRAAKKNYSSQERFKVVVLIYHCCFLQKKFINLFLPSPQAGRLYVHWYLRIK